MIHYLPTLHAPTAACGDRTSQRATRDLGRVTCPRCLRAQHQTGIPEAALLREVRALLEAAGYLYHHHYDSRRSTPGWVDVVGARPGCPLLCLELKTARGQLTREQAMWLDALQQCTGVVARVVRPGDLEDLRVLLQGDTP